MTLYLTADLHLGHEMVGRLRGMDVKEHDEKILSGLSTLTSKGHAMTANAAPTQKQISYLNDLIDKWCAATPNPPSKADIDRKKQHYLLNASREECSKAIDDTIARIEKLRQMSKAGALVKRAEKKLSFELPDADAVPAGRYAVDAISGPNETAFYRVDRPTEGRYAGRVYVKQMHGERDRRLGYGETVAALRNIEASGAEDAAKRYGVQIGRCGVCGIRLTNDHSRAIGIGPVCAGRRGWKY